ncbi:hypothetical protein EVAR_43424_1 [Eumeta japonica]|uniref:Secreted protein n=1 Tax=Eumeta variegata TaxID=151549 RepID=A0A4C1WVA1_EUMVA|nr:hypothetical protein EVAR_43424_1 [Eumeta japonica]
MFYCKVAYLVLSMAISLSTRGLQRLPVWLLVPVWVRNYNFKRCQRELEQLIFMVKRCGFAERQRVVGRFRYCMDAVNNEKPVSQRRALRRLG